MSDIINIALLGLGNVGQEFAENFLEIIQEGGKPVNIIAVAHRDLNSPIVLGFQQSGVRIFENAVDVVSMGEEVDIIFDLTGDTETRVALRQALKESNNRHTVIAPEMMAKLLSMFFGDHVVLSGGKGGGY
jgi:homoserine dehydrogenase